MYTNKLIDEKSPYLLQHAHNPVDWRPWGDEAFEKAREEDKPVFLSVGYSTCHWCHVMERESFESEEVAKFLNEHFVSIKVDREERPDVDRVYMAFVQAATGGGGWPMSVWLTPDRKPFYGGTYYPPVDAYGRPGFPTVLERLAQAWRKDRDQVVEASDKMIEQLKEQFAKSASGNVKLDAGDVENGFYNLRRVFDSEHGGFGQAPKFPRTVSHNFLVRFHAASKSGEALDMVAKTLDKMAAGGMHDHLGGGFHRYSVDNRWFVSHFEKMLYDQAQLAVSYLEAFQITRNEDYARVARGIFKYVRRDMTGEGGAFYSAEDADSVIDAANPGEKGEGAFYIWGRDEIAAVLGEETARWFNYRYGVKEDGNVDHDPQGEFSGKNILFEARTIEETAREFAKPAGEMRLALEEAKQKLLEARSTRVRPHLDDKILTSWNALMISAFALGSRVLEEPGYLEAAERAADFILTGMYDGETGVLRRRSREGETAVDGFLDDYASFVVALIDLYEASFEWRHLETAAKMAETMIELFEDRERGGFFGAADGDENLVIRLKDDYDGAEPSGNSMAVWGLLRLAQMTGRTEFREAAGRAIEAFSPALRSAPVGSPQMLLAFDFALSTPKQVVFAGEKDDPALEELVRETWKTFLPHRVLLLADRAARERLGASLPALAGMEPVDGKPAVYVCENYTCQIPVTEISELGGLLQ